MAAVDPRTPTMTTALELVKGALAAVLGFPVGKSTVGSRISEGNKARITVVSGRDELRGLCVSFAGSLSMSKKVFVLRCCIGSGSARSAFVRTRLLLFFASQPLCGPSAFTIPWGILALLRRAVSVAVCPHHGPVSHLRETARLYGACCALLCHLCSHASPSGNRKRSEMESHVGLVMREP